MTPTVNIRTPGALYDVDIRAGALDEIGPAIRSLTQADTVALVTDETVAALLGMKMDTELARAGFRVLSLTVPAGESSKSWVVAGDLCEALAAGGLSRTDVVVALGGGVIGDLAGFAAAVYLRGIEFILLHVHLGAADVAQAAGVVEVQVADEHHIDIGGGQPEPFKMMRNAVLFAHLGDAFT